MPRGTLFLLVLLYIVMRSIAKRMHAPSVTKIHYHKEEMQVSNFLEEGRNIFHFLSICAHKQIILNPVSRHSQGLFPQCRQTMAIMIFPPFLFQIFLSALGGLVMGTIKSETYSMVFFHVYKHLSIVTDRKPHRYRVDLTKSIHIDSSKLYYCSSCTLRKKCWNDADFPHVLRFWHFPPLLEVEYSSHIWCGWFPDQLYVAFPVQIIGT